MTLYTTRQRPVFPDDGLMMDGHPTITYSARERERPKFSTPVIRTKEDKVFFSTILKVDINRFSSFLAERESLFRSNQMAGLDDEDTLLLYYLFASWWTASEKIK